MADLTASDVTTVRSWTEGGTTGKNRKGALLKLVLTTMGSDTNKIPASALGFTKIESCSNAVASDDTKVYPAVPSNDGLNILLVDLTNVTDANRADPADISATVYIEVHGYR